MVGLTGFGGERAPAAVAVAEDVVAELLVLLRRPQSLAVVGLGLVARLAPHCRRMPTTTASSLSRAPDSEQQEEGSRSSRAEGEGDQLGSCRYRRGFGYTPSEWSALGPVNRRRSW